MNSIIHFFGLKRSGNHAILNWVLKNAFKQSDEVLFRNCVYSPYSHPPKIIYPYDLKVINPHNTKMVLSYEDIALEKVSELPTFIGRDEIIPGAQQKYILLLRDPLNFFASRLKRLSTLESHHVDQDSIKSIQRVGLEQIQKLWLSYAREFTGQTNLLGSNMMRINYNSWFEDKAYRDKWLHENFNVRENFDLGKETVLNYGAGSSFDNLAYDGRASKMNTLGRWRDFVNDELFLQLTDNEEIKKFGKNIFDLEGQTLSSMHSKQFIK